MAQRKKDRFFEREHLIRAGWAALIAGLGILAGCLISSVRGPDEVMVSQPSTGTKPLIVKMERQSEDQTVRLEENLAALLQELRYLSIAQASPQASGASSSQAGRSRVQYSRPLFPQFELPEVVDGYYPESLSAIGSVICPPSPHDPSRPLILGFEALPAIEPAQFTPIFVRVIQERDEPTDLLLSDDQFEFLSGRNAIAISLNVKGVSIRVELGVYARSELKKKYPNFYRTQCDLKLLGAK